MNEISKIGNGLVEVGRECTIGKSIQITFGDHGSVRLGDYVTIGDNVKFIVNSGNIEIGDWSTIHENSIVLCSTGVKIGQHCWFGQGSIIDGTGGLTIEDGVRVGMYSQLWTHVAAGEQIEGCTLFGATPSLIGANAWLVGTCVMGSGVTIGPRTIALAGSNITKSCPPNSVIAGSPAKIKEGLNFYRDVTLNEKFEMLGGWLREFASHEASRDVSIAESEGELTVCWAGDQKVRFHKTAVSFEVALAQSRAGDTHCCIETKRYRKSFTGAERKVLKYLSGNKARFYAI